MDMADIPSSSVPLSEPITEKNKMGTVASASPELPPQPSKSSGMFFSRVILDSLLLINHSTLSIYVDFL